MKRSSVFRDIYDQPYSRNSPTKLQNSCKGSVDILQRMSLLKKLPVHRGCVNTLCWNAGGEYMLSGSDDQKLIVTNCFNYKVMMEHRTTHRANIFSAKFLTDTLDQHVVSCSGDGIILYTDLNRAQESQSNQFNCHYGTTYEVLTLPGEPHTFLSCGEDGTVRWFDLRQKNKCLKSDCKEDVMIACQGAVTALSVSSMRPYQLAIGCSDSTVRIFDRRTLGTRISGGPTQEGALRPLCSFSVPELGNISYRITSLKFSPEGDDVLVSYSSDYLYLFSVKDLSSRALGCTTPPVETPAFASPRTAPPVKRLRLRGDWSDTGPNARPEREGGRRGEVIAQVRPTLHSTLMQRMTDVLARMLNDPATRAALSGTGEDPAILRTSSPSPPPLVDAPLPPAASAPASTSSSPPPMSSLTLGAQSAPNQEEVAMDLTAPSGSASAPLPGEDGALQQQQPQFISNLQDRLTTMRDGFIERHHSEPAVSLSFSDVGSSAGTISLGIGNEVGRALQRTDQTGDGASPADLSQPSTSQTAEASGSGTQEQAPVKAQTPTPAQQGGRDGDEDYGMSDDEEPIVEPRARRTSHPIEDHMEKAMAAIRGETKEKFEEPSTPKPSVKQKYTGHRNARTMIKEASFWGENYVMSGSDCGHVFAWERETGKLVMLLEADKHVVNCIQPHPFLPILATSGIDYDVKLWAPLAEDCLYDESLAEELMKRNEIMLEETRDTITVPASFMIRMLACLNQIRRGGRTPRPRNRRAADDEDV